MSKAALDIYDLGKQYRLGLVGTGTLSHDLNRWWYRLRSKPDPYLEVGQKNTLHQKGDSPYIWALENINLQIATGETVGLIGSNGAGKSTLLKILSRVTAPTKGGFRAAGKIASLLEVGTGFHNELTGRENIYLNGAILGMKKSEITAKLQAIIDFSEIEKYADTPIKRYSSGMKVRLAFAVAAHLDPDILIVDEVLAVGDAKFQEKALGKIKDVSQSGQRTVLFVSHNMEAIKRVCSRGVLLHEGAVQFDGEVNECIRQYYQLNFERSSTLRSIAERTDRSGKGDFRVTGFSFLDGQRQPSLFAEVGQPLHIEMEISAMAAGRQHLHLEICIRNDSGEVITYLSTWPIRQTVFVEQVKKVNFKICKMPLTEGHYFLDVLVKDGSMGDSLQDEVLHAAKLQIKGKDFFATGQVMNDPAIRTYIPFELVDN